MTTTPSTTAIIVGDPTDNTPGIPDISFGNDSLLPALPEDAPIVFNEGSSVLDFFDADEVIDAEFIDNAGSTLRRVDRGGDTLSDAADQRRRARPRPAGERGALANDAELFSAIVEKTREILPDRCPGLSIEQYALNLFGAGAQAELAIASARTVDELANIIQRVTNFGDLLAGASLSLEGQDIQSRGLGKIAWLLNIGDLVRSGADLGLKNYKDNLYWASRITSSGVFAPGESGDPCEAPKAIPQELRPTDPELGEETVEVTLIACERTDEGQYRAREIEHSIKVPTELRTQTQAIFAEFASIARKECEARNLSGPILLPSDPADRRVGYSRQIGLNFSRNYPYLSRPIYKLTIPAPKPGLTWADFEILQWERGPEKGMLLADGKIETWNLFRDRQEAIRLLSQIRDLSALQGLEILTQGYDSGEVAPGLVRCVRAVEMEREDESGVWQGYGRSWHPPGITRPSPR